MTKLAKELCVATIFILIFSSCTSKLFDSKSKEIAPITTAQTVDIADLISNIYTEVEGVSVDVSEVIPTDNEPHDSDIRKSAYPKMEPFTSSQSSEIMISEYKAIEIKDFSLPLKDYKEGFCYPVDVGYATSNFGWRHGRMHSGVDLKAYKGDNIYAVFDGVVRMSKYYSAYGNCIVIRHYNGLETVYSHASKLLAKVNQEVKAGDVIALAGSTGRATGVHLHFEVRIAGKVIDPSLVINTTTHSLRDGNLYITTKQNRLFASNDDSEEVRESEIKEALSVKYHIVKSGDMLSKIAVNNNTTVTNLCCLNNLSRNSVLRINQRIRVQ